MLTSSLAKIAIKQVSALDERTSEHLAASSLPDNRVNSSNLASVSTTTRGTLDSFCEIWYDGTGREYQQPPVKA
jgi:hypothetical protein